MRHTVALAAIAGFLAPVVRAQSPSPQDTPTPPPVATPAPAASPGPPGKLPPPVPIPVLRLSDPPVISVETLPAENPFATAADAPALPPVKPVLADAKIPASLFAAVRVDAKGKPVTVRRARDPIPALAAQTQQSLLRWSFDPGRKGGQAVEAWAALRLDLTAEIDAPKVESLVLTPITATTPIPRALDWGSDASWLEGLKPAPPGDGALAAEQLDTPAMPKKQPWSSSSFKGPFSIKFWVRLSPAGRIEKAIPIQASEPLLVAYFRKGMEAWAFRPARAANAAVATWNELSISGQVDYSTELRMTTSLRQSL